METEQIQISALEHYSYCPRQCALIHLEQTFDENIYTIKGHLLHERVHEEEVEHQAGVRVERALPLWSERLGLIGKADVVEFHGKIPYPVEYKHGPRRRWGHAELQLCAQGMCLEEMTGQLVAAGAIFFQGSRHRAEVSLSEALRNEVVQTISAIRQLLATATLPPPVNDARCSHCSLKDSCLPEVIGEPERVVALQQELYSEGG